MSIQDAISSPCHTPVKDWISLDDSALLEVRLCDLGVALENTDLESLVDQVRHELEARAIEIQPKFYLGDEWFSPEGECSISIPFYLAHPRLKTLEQNQMMEVEGGDPEYCLKLLRHELGHCVDHAFSLSRTKSWRVLFGGPDRTYDPLHYRPKPYSKSYVKNLDHWYAQSHPDEDWAETFAVWLDPSSRWKKTYARWPGALKKLEYVDHAMGKLAGKTLPSRVTRQTPYDVRRLKSTLGSYYKKRKTELAEQCPDFFDGDLLRLFAVRDQTREGVPASSWLLTHYPLLMKSVSFWTKESKISVRNLLYRIQKRCDELGLILRGSESELLVGTSAFLSTLVNHYRFTGRFRR